jgi:hypothetical protein
VRTVIRFVFEINGQPRPGEIELPTERRNSIWLSVREPVTIAEAKALGEWLCRKARE